MPTIGDIVLKSMRETKPGIKGTESETLGDWIFGRKKAREPKKRPGFTWREGLKWLDPRVHIGTLGEMIFGKKKEEKPLIAPWEATGLGVRGYSQEDIDKALRGQIGADMGKILEEQGKTVTSEDMAERLRGLGYSDDEIIKVGVKL